MLVESALNTSELAEDALDNTHSKEIAKEFIAHHGIKGQRWGIRRFQNPDGSLTEAGRKRYSGSKGKEKLRKDFKNDPSGEGKVLKQLASGKREKAISALSEVLENEGTDIANDAKYLKEKGYVKNNKEAAEYLVKAAQKCNENYDDDVSMFQSLSKELDLYQKGYIDKKTFDALYDAKAAEDIMEFKRNSYDWHGEGVKGAINANKYKSTLNNRLSYWFGDNPNNPEYNPKKPVSVSNNDYDDYDDLMYLEELDHSFKTEAKEFIAHHGIKGQRWGIRRFQNPDGSLTPEGRKRWGVGPALEKIGKAGKTAGKLTSKALRKATGHQTDEELDAEIAKARKKNARKEKQRELDELTGKKKKLNKMTDQELDEYLNTITKQRNVRKMEQELKELNRGPIEKAIRKVASNSIDGISEGVKRGITAKIETSMKRGTERKQNLKDDKFKEKHMSREEREEEATNRIKNITQNKLEATKNVVEREAYKGDRTATNRIETINAAKKGNKPEADPYGKKVAQNKRDTAVAKLEAAAAVGDQKALRDLEKLNIAKKGGGKKAKVLPEPTDKEKKAAEKLKKELDVKNKTLKDTLSNGPSKKQVNNFMDNYYPGYSKSKQRSNTNVRMLPAPKD